MRAIPVAVGLALLAVSLVPPALRAEEEAAVLVFFESAAPGGEDVDVVGQRIAADGSISWNGGQPLPVGASLHRDTSPVACSDGRGGAIVAYVVEFTSGAFAGDSDVVAQRVGPDGRALWNDARQPVLVGSLRLRESAPAILPDGAGGAIVVYTATGEGGGTDLLAQRLSPEGTLLWNEGKPVVLAASEGSERAPVLVPDGLGGVLVFYEWESGKDVDVMGQRVLADGRLAWNDGVRSVDLCASRHLERHPAAAPDGGGGAIVAFEVEFTSGDSAGDHDVVARRVGPDGSLAWGEAVVALGGSVQHEREPAIAALPGGGAVVAFEVEYRAGASAGDVDIVAQRVDAGGVPRWNEGKTPAPVCTSPQRDRRPAVLAVGLEEVVLAFDLEIVSGPGAGDGDVLAQGLTADGRMMWNEGRQSSVVGSSGFRESGPVLVPDGVGGVVCVFTSGADSDPPAAQGIRAQRLDRGGRPRWNEGKRAVDAGGTGRLERHPCAVFLPAR